MSVDNDRKNMLIAMFGSTLISFAPLFYRYSEANPATGAFFRMSYALPFLILIILLSKPKITIGNAIIIDLLGFSPRNFQLTNVTIIT